MSDITSAQEFEVSRPVIGTRHMSDEEAMKIARGDAPNCPRRRELTFLEQTGRATTDELTELSSIRNLPW